mgnify:CR=1 FL=1
MDLFEGIRSVRNSFIKLVPILVLCSFRDRLKTAIGEKLLSLLILPLIMPVLIFGARTVSLAAADDGVAAGTYFLAAYAVLALSLAPFATAAALRISNE